jgi:hypothetical protein
LDEKAYVEIMHPHVVKLWAEHVRKKEEKYGRVVKDDATADPAAYVTRILAEAFRASPKAFAFPTIDTVRIHGVVMDQGTAYVVYSTIAEEEDGLRQPATLMFRQDQGTWKLWSLALFRVVVKTWPEAARQDGAPENLVPEP